MSELETFDHRELESALGATTAERDPKLAVGGLSECDGSSALAVFEPV